MPSILVKLPNWMGDILFSYDVLYTLSQHYDRVGLLTSVAHAELLECFPIPRATTITYDTDSWPNLDRETILKIQEFSPDAGLLLPNSIGSALTLRYAGISPLYGYNTEHRGFLLHKSIPRPYWKIHQTEYYIALLELLHLKASRYPVNGESEHSGPVVIHPGASRPERAWHLHRFVSVADALQKAGKEVLFVSQKALELPIEYRTTTTIRELQKILRSASLFIGNDSGPLHLAQQCGVPVVGLYGPGDPAVTGPRSISKSRVIYKNFPCSPCRQKFFQECDPSTAGKPFCLETISAGEVVQAALHLLS